MHATSITYKLQNQIDVSSVLKDSDVLLKTVFASTPNLLYFQR